MHKEFNVDFLGLNGAIDEKTVRAIFQGDGDIAKLPSDFENIGDVENAADIIEKQKYRCHCRLGFRIVY